MSPSMEARIAKYAALPTPPLPPPSPLSPWSSPLPQIPSPPLPPPTVDSPTYAEAPLGYRAVGIRIRASSPPVPALLPLLSSPLPPLLFLPPVDRREDIPEDELPPRKRLCSIAPTSRYEVGESSTAAPTPTRGHRESLIAMLVAYVSSLQGHLAMALGEIRALQARDQTRVDAPEGAGSSALNNMPPKRTSAAATPMTAVAIEQLITESDSCCYGSHNSGTGIRGTTRTPRECTYKDFLNCHPLNFKGTKGVVVLAQWFEKMELVFHISNYAMDNQVKFVTCTFIGNAFTWWNSHMKVVTQDVAYDIDWKTLKRMMT
ncbi:hypothetical protein Tco_1049596, partial [Tanacetum coccineum]